MKTMLITGTTQGIGKAIHDRFCNTYNIITVNRREFGDNNFICDLSVLKETKVLCEQIKDIDVDVLINNAGGAEPIDFMQLSAEELMKVTNLNYHSPILLMQTVLNSMQKKGGGRIINISSVASNSPRSLIPHYGAAKSALERFSSSLAVTYSNCGICINCVSPGGVSTITSINNRERMASIDGLQKEFYNNKITQHNGLGRLIEPEEVVSLIEFLISERASVISGQVYSICGTMEVF